jgi:hypothetical protein
MCWVLAEANSFICQLLQEHYCIALGINDRDGWFASFGFHTPKAEVLRLPGGKQIALN